MDTVHNLNEDDKKLFWFCGYILGKNTEFLGLHVLIILINEYIWSCKLRKTSLSLHSLMFDLDITMRTVIAASRKMLLSCKKIDMPIFRRWCRWEQQQDGEEEED
jgi:hypothetical protein